MMEVNSKYKGNLKYFDELFDSFEIDGFYDNLFTFFMKRDIKGFKPNKIPMTETKQEILEANKSPYQLFYEEYYREFDRKEGWSCDVCYETYKEFAKNNGYFIPANNKFGVYMKPFVDKTRKRDGKLRYYTYVKKLIINELEDDK